MSNRSYTCRPRAGALNIQSFAYLGLGCDAMRCCQPVPDKTSAPPHFTAPTPTSGVVSRSTVCDAPSSKPHSGSPSNCRRPIAVKTTSPQTMTRSALHYERLRHVGHLCPAGPYLAIILWPSNHATLGKKQVGEQVQLLAVIVDEWHGFQPLSDFLRQWMQDQAVMPESQGSKTQMSLCLDYQPHATGG